MSKTRKPINLALQGGGSHGAFTWGVLDRLLEDDRLDPERYKHVLVHRIEAEDEIKPLGASSKVNAEWAFLRHLFDIGRRAADGWVAGNFDDLGTRSTVDLKAMFQGG